MNIVKIYLPARLIEESGSQLNNTYTLYGSCSAIDSKHLDIFVHEYSLSHITQPPSHQMFVPHLFNFTAFLPIKSVYSNNFFKDLQAHLFTQIKAKSFHSSKRTARIKAPIGVHFRLNTIWKKNSIVILTIENVSPDISYLCAKTKTQF